MRNFLETQILMLLNLYSPSEKKEKKKENR